MLYDNIKSLKLNVKNDLDSKKFAKLIDNIKSSLNNIKFKSNFDILSLYENSIVNFVNNIKVDENNTIETIINSKQQVTGIGNTINAHTQTKQQIKAKRKQMILNQYTSLTTSAAQIYKKDIEKMKRKKGKILDAQIEMFQNAAEEIEDKMSSQRFAIANS